MAWKMDDDLGRHGLVLTANTIKLPLGKTNNTFQVYKIPLNLLKYNANNGRIFMEINKLKADGEINLSDLEYNDVEEYNKEIENLIWNSDVERNEVTKNDIERWTQQTPGVVLSDGTVVDGNRRFTCLRRLHAEHPEDERFSFFDAAILFMDDGTITRKDLKSYELRVQFGKDEKVGYRPVNFAMSIYNEIKSGEFTIQEVSEYVKQTPSKITQIVRTCELIEEFLEYIKHKGDLSIAEELNIYWPMEPLASYMNSEGNKLTEVEKLRRKHLFFDYLLTVDIALPTQEFRDNLIKKIFKDEVLWNELATKYEETAGEKVHTAIIQDQVESTPTAFVERVKNFKKSDTAKVITHDYKTVVDKKNMATLANAPVQISEDVVGRIEQINIDPFIKATSATADEKLRQLKKNLEKAKASIDLLLEQVNRKLN